MLHCPLEELFMLLYSMALASTAIVVIYSVGKPGGLWGLQPPQSLTLIHVQC